MRRILIAAAATVGVVAGCGSTAPDQVSVVVRAFLRDVARGDGAGACAELTPAAVSQLERSLSVPCAQALSGVAPTASERRTLERAHPDVSADGNTATATYPSAAPGGAPRTLSLQKAGGRWRISSLPANG